MASDQWPVKAACRQRFKCFAGFPKIRKLFRGDWPLTTGHWPLLLGFDADVADAADQIIGGGFAIFHGDDFDGEVLVVGSKNEMVAGRLHVFHGAAFILEYGIHVELAFAIGLE